MLRRPRLLRGCRARRACAAVCRRPAVSRNSSSGSRRQASRRTVVLASGDPLFYGTARYVCAKLGKDRFEVVPHVSSMQLAFARVKESWEEAFLTNLAGQSIERVIDRIRTSETAGLFTSEQWPPAAVAQALLEHGIDSFQAYVCENLGSPDERVTQGSLAEIARRLVRPAQRDDPGPQGQGAGAGRAGGHAAVRQSRRVLPAVAAQAGPAHAGGSRGRWRLAELGLRPDEHRLGRRRGSGLGGPRGGPAGPEREGVCDRDGSRRPCPDPGECPAVRRGQPRGRAGPGAGGLGRSCRLPMRSTWAAAAATWRCSSRRPRSGSRPAAGS